MMERQNMGGGMCSSKVVMTDVLLVVEVVVKVK